jgi:hypothetical protein
MFLGIHKSDKSDKKYYAEFENQSGRKKHVYFGAAGMNDYTLFSPAERDIRKALYLARHRRTENWDDPESSGALSRWILWNLPTISESLADYKKRFNF